MSGGWSALVHAVSEVEVRDLHEQEHLLLPTVARQYPGPFWVEALPPEFVPPPVLEALERADFASAESWLGLHSPAEEEA